VLEIKVLGDLQVLRGGTATALPPARKTRALLAYLALTRHPHRREQLCEMFWDVPDDPRGSLRWSLSKIRPLVDDPAFPRLLADRQSVELRGEGLDVDFLSAQVCAEEKPTATGNLARAASFFRGPLLADLELPENSDFHTWLLGMREDARQLQAKILGSLIERLSASPEEALP
jgi:DNA-binding SARP family transcriptional activator